MNKPSMDLIEFLKECGLTKIQIDQFILIYSSHVSNS